jgi:hypothetical protein
MCLLSMFSFFRDSEEMLSIANVIIQLRRSGNQTGRCVAFEMRDRGIVDRTFEGKRVSELIRPMSDCRIGYETSENARCNCELNLTMARTCRSKLRNNGSYAKNELGAPQRSGHRF